MNLLHILKLLIFVILLANCYVGGHYNSSTITKDKRKGKFLFDLLFGIEELDLGAAADTGDNDLKTCDCGEFLLFYYYIYYYYIILFKGERTKNGVIVQQF